MALLKNNTFTLSGYNNTDSNYMNPAKGNDNASFFRDIVSGDPIVEKDKSVITLRPFYWNYNFITNFVPLIVSIYILTQQSDLAITLVCILIAIGSAFLLLQELSYYNKILIKVDKKTIMIRPNFVWKYKNTKQIFFKDIMSIYVKSRGFWPSFRRYLIIVVLANKNGIILISARDNDTAQQISRELSNIVQKF
jgi:hypothetical protein